MNNTTSISSPLRKRFLRIAAITAGLWGLGLRAQAQQPGNAPEQLSRR